MDLWQVSEGQLTGDGAYPRQQRKLKEPVLQPRNARHEDVKNIK